MLGKIITAVAISGAVIAAVPLSASASATSAPPPAKVGCVSSGSRTLYDVFENPASLRSCPRGSFEVSLYPPVAAPAPSANPVVIQKTLIPDDDTADQLISEDTREGLLTLTEPGTYQVVVNAAVAFNGLDQSPEVQTAVVTSDEDGYIIAGGTSYVGNSYGVAGWISETATVVVPAGGTTLTITAICQTGDYYLEGLTVTASSPDVS